MSDIDKTYFTRLAFFTKWLESLDEVTLKATMNWLKSRIQSTESKRYKLKQLNKKDSLKPKGKR